MSTLINASIKGSELKNIDKTKVIVGKKDTYIPITISINDQSRFGKNVSISVQQSPEEREKKEKKHFIGEGSVIWTDGNIVKGQKDQPATNSEPFETVEKKSTDQLDDLPF